MIKMLRLAAHEFVKHLRRPLFVGTTLLLPLIGAAVTLWLGSTGGQTALPLSENGDLLAFDGAIGYVDHSGLLEASSAAFSPTVLRAYADETAAREAARSGTIVAFYVVPHDYLQSGTVTRYARQFGTSDTPIFRTFLRAHLLGDAQLARMLDQPLRLTTIRIDAAGNAMNGPASAASAQIAAASVVPYVFAVLLYVTIFFAAGFLLQSITEEKENRTIEIMLTSLAPLQLLGGKVLGLGLLGLVQMLIWLIAGRSLLGVATERLIEPGLALSWSVWVLAIVYFLLGYGVNAGIMAGIGSTVGHFREGSQIVALLALPFVIPLWFLNTIVEAPNGTLARVLSIFPLTAPVTMMIRVSLADVAAGELALSLALLALCVTLVIWLAARLFRIGTLLTGKRLSIGEIARAIRTA